METKVLLELKEVKSINVEHKIRELMQGSRFNEYNDSYYTSVALACVLDWGIENNTEQLMNQYLDTLDESISDFIRYHIKDITNLFPIEHDLTHEELLSFILFRHEAKGRNESTPETVTKLVNKILNVQDNDSIYDLCCGCGNYLLESYILNPTLNLNGVEINFNELGVAKLKFYMIQKECNFLLADALAFNEKADKLFTSSPMGYKNLNKRAALYNLSQLGIIEETYAHCSSEWVFNSVLLNNLKETGKGVSVVSVGSLWNYPDRKIRQFFLQNGFIEAVILLPANLFYGFSVPVALIVFSKEKNTKVRFVDASNLYSKDSKMLRHNILSDENIEQIINCLQKDSDISIEITNEQLLKEECQLNPQKHLVSLPTFENGIAFGEIIKDITRGSQIKASELDKYKSVCATNIKYLMLNNIDKSGIKFGEDQYLKELPEKTEKYCIKNNSIVLSKTTGVDFKSVVVEVSDDEVILANGNVYVIELDETKADPFYVQSFLQSSIGQKIIKASSAGTALLTLPVKNLKEMIIPLPSLEKQKEIGIKYATAVDELNFLQNKIEKIYLKMENIFEGE